MTKQRLPPAILALGLALSTGALAENRFYFSGSTLPFSGVNVEIQLRGDNDQATLGYSFALEAPTEVVLLKGVRSEGTVAESADFFGGTVLPDSGIIGYGCVFAFEGVASAALPPGTGRLLAKIDLDVVGQPGSVAQITYPTASDPAPPNPVLANIFTDAAGSSVNATGQVGTFTVVDLRPSITEVRGASGYPGDTFELQGDNLDAPGLAVRVCGLDAEASLLPGGAALLVTAPDCPVVGPADIEVCTDLGCAGATGGYEYLAERAFARGEANGDGDVDLSDAVAVALHLFGGTPSPACADALDSNDDGAVTVADAIFLARFVVLGEAMVPTPFPDPGADPTPDALPPCRTT